MIECSYGLRCGNICEGPEGTKTGACAHSPARGHSQGMRAHSSATSVKATCRPCSANSCTIAAPMPDHAAGNEHAAIGEAGVTCEFVAHSGSEHCANNFYRNHALRLHAEPIDAQAQRVSRLPETWAASCPSQPWRRAGGDDVARMQAHEPAPEWLSQGCDAKHHRLGRAMLNPLPVELKPQGEVLPGSGTSSGVTEPRTDSALKGITGGSRRHFVHCPVLSS